ncbi:FtsW/RodA/SpoVE family cell cycle protein [Bacillus altitudinis]|uniref:FtsW/RodA/SpoVE family cell cycle protein n=1 Tax=Bacillus altitudinis TaxID=293387 RepID=UPI001C2249EA|nr:FtsW/RodA/SpoVE family cell cycle protein [Bacillus altitudinis]MBU8692077.1 FtsW/RodA/SpoVE family cell cycle protein [Bacillus altitudinis]
MGLEKKFEQYIKNVCKRIKNKDVHASIKLELRDHLYTLKEEAISAGMSEEEAVNQALDQIGDAAILGMQLHETHKTQVDFKTILLVLATCSFGLFVMYYFQFHSHLLHFQDTNIFYKSLIYYVFGLALMFGLFAFDYRRFLPYSWHLYIGTIGMLILTMMIGTRVNGILFLSLNNGSINLTEIFPFLMIISLAGIYQSWNWKNGFKSWLGLAIVTLPIILLHIVGSLSATITFMVICITMMYVSHARMRQLIPFTAAGIVYLMVQLFSLYQAGMSHFYQYSLHEFSSNGFQINPYALYDVHTDWMLTYIIYSFGWFAGLAVFILFVTLIYRVVHTAKRVQSAYGKMLMIGLATTFAAKFILSIFTNFGLLPISGVSMPFMSYGGSHILLEMMSVGLLMSIYRRKQLGEMCREVA